MLLWQCRPPPVGRGVRHPLQHRRLRRGIRPLHEAGLVSSSSSTSCPPSSAPTISRTPAATPPPRRRDIVFPSWVRTLHRSRRPHPPRGHPPSGPEPAPHDADEHRAKRQRTRREHGITDDQRIVLGVGFGDVRKGLDLWSALVRSRHRVPGARSVWAAASPTIRHCSPRPLRAVGLEDHLLLPDQMPDPPPCHAAADLFVLTTGGSIPQSSLSHGLRPADHRLREVWRHRRPCTRSGRHPYLDVPAMADAIAGLLTDAPVPPSWAKPGPPHRCDFHYAVTPRPIEPAAHPVSPSSSSTYYARHLRQRLESTDRPSVRSSSSMMPRSMAAPTHKPPCRRCPVPVRVVLNDTNRRCSPRARGVGLARGDSPGSPKDEPADPASSPLSSPPEDPDVVLSYSDSRMVGEDDRVLAPDYRAWTADIDPVRWTADFRASGLEAVAEAFAVKNTLPNVSAAVFRRAALQAVLDEHVDAMAECRSFADRMCITLANGGVPAFTGRPQQPPPSRISVTSPPTTPPLAEIQPCRTAAVVARSQPHSRDCPGYRPLCRPPVRHSLRKCSDATRRRCLTRYSARLRRPGLRRRPSHATDAPPKCRATPSGCRRRAGRGLGIAPPFRDTARSAPNVSCSTSAPAGLASPAASQATSAPRTSSASTSTDFITTCRDSFPGPIFSAVARCRLSSSKSLRRFRCRLPVFPPSEAVRDGPPSSPAFSAPAAWRPSPPAAAGSSTTPPE